MKNSRNHRLCWLSSYDRGLDHLLFMWSDIQKAVPDATLDVAYGWDTFDKLTTNNQERKNWKEKMLQLLQQPGITEHGRLGKEELTTLRRESGILAYCTDFFEINCITALECQKDGCVPVVMDTSWPLGKEEIHSALHETVYSGIKVEGNIKTVEGMENYKKALLNLMTDQVKWEELSFGGKNNIAPYAWDKIADQWIDTVNTIVYHPKVSIITPTIRSGFWDLMAQNIASQTYPNIEWIVVDDSIENRESLLKEVGKQYKLDVQYVRGKKYSKGFPYIYGLSSANNCGLEKAKGELLVFLQDFMFMPKDGIELLVNLHRAHPTSLLAPVDIAVKPIRPPMVDMKNWFSGMKPEDTFGELIRKNIRCKGIGIRPTNNPADWEMNYCAIPTAVAKDLGGWYEFFNDGLGFDNTEIAYRALLSGYTIFIDDTNIATALDHWEALKDKPEELGENRTHNLNDPRYVWMVKQIKDGKLPIKRDKKAKERVLSYTIPKELTADEAVTWMRSHTDEIVEGWK